MNAKSPNGITNKVMRVLWWGVQSTLFRMSPKPCHRWRVFLLKLFGAEISFTSRVYPRAKIWGPWNLVMGEYATIANDVDCYCYKQITICAKSTVSQYTYLCGATHDFELANHPLIPMPIFIGEGVWIAADVFVGPGVVIGDYTVVGARSSVFSDLPAWKVCVGTPAKPIRDRIILDAPQMNQPESVRDSEASL